MTVVETAPVQRAPFTIPSLDGIRALSFMVVFLAHAGVPNIPGGFGVTVFFFLSGYLITTLLRREASRNGRISFKLFYLRRALRILPPFYLVLSAALLLALLGVLPRSFAWADLTAQLLHYSNYHIIFHGWDGLIPGTGVYWSLAVEEHFYLLFPALYTLLLRLRASRGTQNAVLLTLCLVIMAWRCHLVFNQGLVGDRTYLGSDTRFDSMLFGCALAVWGNPALDLPRRARPHWLELLTAVAGAGLLLLSFVLRNPEFRESVRYTVQGVGLYPLFRLFVRYPDLLLGRLLNWRPLAFLGTLSYSLYLLHHIVIYVFQTHLPGRALLSSSLAFVVSLLLAVVIWRTIERPLGSLRKSLNAPARAG